MDTKPEESVRSKMESLKLACDREIPAHLQKADSAAAALRESLASIRARVQETVHCQGKLGQVKAKLREAEEELFKALAAKTRKETKRMAMTDAIAARKARIDELRRVVQDQRAKRDEYGAILSQQFSESEDRSIKDSKEEIEEVISWYNKVLGFYIEGGHGVRFTFKNINLKNPDEEFCFTVRHANDVYTLIDCDPHLNEIKELLDELNRTNGLFKFVRDMRQRFQEAASRGLPMVMHQEYSTISGSAPALSMSTVRSESFAKSHEHHQVQHEKPDRQVKKLSPGKWNKSQSLSPGSALSLRRSPRFKVKK
ncbi:putative chromosome segregation protein Spc25 [Rosa chinensis]|uniref:Kinetochore protein SPC25 n=1 Tax=Rosa chinensis TaxID=74649 RepID=A0A2P6P5R3_ROSCH|nr:kinetochore protein SPC25 homolog [Rosa chinensis]PRQ17256.1 putative chromosome segregation protein Spc25 [Rosa chinensis]